MSELRKAAARSEIRKFQNMRAASKLPASPAQVQDAGTPVIDVENLPQSNYGYSSPSPQLTTLDGNKFPGGFGLTQIFQKDYFELRRKSAQLFEENLYARGMIRRLVTNIINTGLNLESTPQESILGLEADSLNDWSEDVETRFDLWATNERVCDFFQKDDFYKLQAEAKVEAFIDGDILQVIRVDKTTNIPAVQLISGEKVSTPLGDEYKLAKGHKITYGVELDQKNRQVAYWVKDDDGKHQRIRAFGRKSGRRIAKLIYGCDKRRKEVRGEPILSIALQSLKEIDRYRDSVQRKAVINSILAMFISKKSDKPGTLPIQNGAVKRGAATVTDDDGKSRDFNITKHIPGMVIEELQTDEEPKAFGSEGTDLAFGEFEEAIIQAFAWAYEVPPEILRLAFSSNYSASQAANNEFKIFLNRVRADFGKEFCRPVYLEWLLAETMMRKINAPGLLEAWRDPSDFETFGAWTSSDWSGAIKPSTDIVKTAKGYKTMVEEFFISQDRASREVSGQKFTTIVKSAKRANQMKADAMRPILELKQEFGEQEVDAAIEKLEAMQGEITENAAEIVAENLNITKK